MRILQLAPRFPFPTDDGGKIGIANIYRQFSDQGAEVTFIAYKEENEKIPESAIREAEKYGRVLLINHSTLNSKSRILKSLISSSSIYCSKHYSQETKQKILDLIIDQDFDIVHADHSAMAKMALDLAGEKNARTGIRLHNIEWMIWQRYADMLPAWHPKRWYIQTQANRLKREEMEFFPAMDVCFAITEKEKQQALQMSSNANVTVASAGVNPEDWKPDSNVEKNPNEIILATTYHWVHNVDAVRWFINEVLPLIRQEVPKAFLSLIGKEAPGWLHEMKDKGVNVLGYVDSVQPHLRRASVYIAPLFVGAGIRIKILEAMAIGLPVVATPVSAEGINATPESGLFISDDAREYADIIIKLLKNSNKAISTGKNAREYIINNFSWKHNVGKMLEEYRKLLNI